MHNFRMTGIAGLALVATAMSAPAETKKPTAPDCAALIMKARESGSAVQLPKSCLDSAPIKPKMSSRCIVFDEAIEDSLKEMSYLAVEDIGDNGAPRATMRATQRANDETEIQNNILLMKSSNCPAFQEPISASVYMAPAMICRAATATATLAALREQASRQSASNPDGGGFIPPTLPPECDRSKWTPR